jgi:hypothetical protein
MTAVSAITAVFTPATPDERDNFRSTLRSLAGLSAMWVGVIYLVVLVFAPFALGIGASVPVQIGIGASCAGTLIGVFYNKIEPAIWSIGYLVALGAFMGLGQVTFGDATFGGGLWTGMAGIIAFVAAMQWLEDRLNHRR